MRKDILVCGVGGQGTVLASKLIASAAMDCGEMVHSAETIGMAQRGGSVTSHIRIGEDAFSPLIPKGKADMIIAFEPAEAVRNLPYLKKGGTVIVNTNPVKPIGEALLDTGYDGTEMIAYLKKKCNCIAVDGEEILKPYKTVKCLNVMLLGVAAGQNLFDFSSDVFLAELEKRVAPRFVDMNKKVFKTGMEAAV